MRVTCRHTQLHLLPQQNPSQCPKHAQHALPPQKKHSLLSGGWNDCVIFKFDYWKHIFGVFLIGLQLHSTGEKYVVTKKSDSGGEKTPMGVIAIVSVVGGGDHKLAGRPQAAVLIPQFTKKTHFNNSKKR